MNSLLKKLKQKFDNNEEVSKDVFKELVEKDFESVLENVKEEYSMMFQSNRHAII